ncbi:MAG: 2-C-methyl-D-erythritol 4-phosphate cytidylyltransferase, partial [Alloacidobacterium sp.]
MADQGLIAFLYTPMFMRVFVILPAAGLGTRMAAGHHAPSAPKQFLELAGVPILIHSLRAFAQVPQVSGMYVAVRANERERLEAQVAEHGFSDKVRIVTGGDSRQESVANALNALDCDADDIVLVHDAV